MKRKAILLAAIGLSALAGGAPASAQYGPIEYINRFWDGSRLVAVVEYYCDGGAAHYGDEIQGWHEVEHIYYGC